MKSLDLTDLDKLKNWIENNNHARLKYIQPRSVAEEINITEEKAENLLTYLVDIGQATRYLIFKCPGQYCEEEIVINSEDIKKRTDCDICSTVFTPINEEYNFKDVMYEIYKEDEKITYGVDYRNKYFGKNMVVPTKSITIKSNKTAEVIQFKNENQEKEENDYKIFISHNEKDANLANIIINLLEELGIDSDGSEGKIFCSSALGRGVAIGDDIFEEIKDKFDDKIIVLFLFTPNFYKSPACMCEMGATWIKVKEFIPLVIEPMEFSHIRGIINTNIKGFDLCNYSKFAELTNYFIKKFDLEEPNNIKYEKIKEKYIKEINLYKSNLGD